MQITQCPILYPTFNQFQNFYEYIHFLDRSFKKEYGMVKVVPPENWRSKSSQYHDLLQKLEVKHAIEQNVQGRAGFYESKNIVQKQMGFKAYRKYSERQSEKVKGLSSQEKEKLFWKTVTYSSPIYGADLTGSLMDEAAGSWNMNSLDSLLKYAMPYRIKGVTEPYCYIGTWKAFFSWHKEDLDLSAINYIHQGQPKIWYSIAEQDSHILQECAKQHYRTQYIECKEFLRHKTFLIHPEMLLKEYPHLRISKAVHNAGEIMLVFGGAYHQGFNCGFNIAQAVNYATTDWLGRVLGAQSCSCSKRSVKVSVESILYNLEESSKFEELLGNEAFEKIRSFVQQKQIEDAMVQGMIEDVKDVEMNEIGEAEKENIRSECAEEHNQEKVKSKAKKTPRKDKKKPIAKKAKPKKLTHNPPFQSQSTQFAPQLIQPAIDILVYSQSQQPLNIYQQ